MSAESYTPAEREFQNQQRQQSHDAQQKEILRQLQEKEKADREKPLPTQMIAPDLVGGKSFKIDRITLDTGDVTIEQPLEIFRRYQGKVLGSSELLKLLREVNDYYAAKGYVTSVATLPPQDLSSGTLVIRMLWGKVAGFLINGEPPQGWNDQLMLLSAMPGIAGSVFNIHISDQIIENLSTVGKSVQVEVQPAAQTGYSYLNLKVSKRLPMSGSIAIDNSGSERADGNTRANAQLVISDLLGFNDSLSFNTSKRFFKERTDDNSERVGAVNWQLPVGHWTLSASYSRIHSQQLFTTARKNEYHNESIIEDIKVKLNRVLARDQHGKTNAWLELSKRNNATYFEGILTKISSRKYSQFTLGISHATLIAGGAAYMDLSWTKGVPWFNGYMEPSDAPANAQETDFNLYSSNLSWQRPDTLLGIPLVYEVRTGLQYSDDRLLGKNKQYLGDEYTVRGFKDTPLSGDSGAYLSTGISFPIALNGVIRRVTPLIGLDYGWARNNQQGQHSGFISGMALGVKLDAKNTQASLIFGLPLQSENANDFGSVLYASVNYRL